jgi:hypothetical protein
MREGWKDYGVENRRSGMIIGLNGVAQAGKDTVGKILCEKHGFERLAFADAMKTGLYNLNPIVGTVYGTPIRLKKLIDEIGWDEAKVAYPEIRELMQRYGTEAGREIHGQNCWISILEKTIRANPTTNYVITDMRFPDELDMVTHLGGQKIQVKRKGKTSVNSHISDAILDEVFFDGVLHNNGTLEQLEDAVNAMVKAKGLVKYTQAY